MPDPLLQGAYKTHTIYMLLAFRGDEGNKMLTKRAVSCEATGRSSFWKRSTIDSMQWLSISRSVSSESLRRSGINVITISDRVWAQKRTLYDLADLRRDGVSNYGLNELWNR